MKTIALFACVLTTVMWSEVLADSVTRPNIVIIIADDLGYGETAMQGNPQIPTPGIDALSESGVRCTSGYVTSSLCSPSRAGLLTGKYQARFGYDMNPIGAQNLSDTAGLPLTETTFISKLKESGYRTGLVGKWHLGASKAKHPMMGGFDYFTGFLQEGHYFVPGPPYDDVQTMVRTRQLPEGEFEREGNIFRGNYTGNNEPNYDKDNPWMVGEKTAVEKEYLTDAITRNAVAFIESDNDTDKPFAIVVAYNAVHSPMQGMNADLERLYGIDDPQRKIFAAMLVALDRGVAKIREAIEKRDAVEETLVVFFSDNGGPTLELTSSNSPLRGGKGDLYEGGIRVPMVWSMPGTIPQGTVEKRAIVTVDIASTCLAISGVADAESLDGVNVVPYFTGEKRSDLHERIYWRMGGGRTALRVGDWKIIRTATREPFELYHLAADASEKENLAGEHPARLSEMVHAWLAMDSEMQAPIVLITPK